MRRKVLGIIWGDSKGRTVRQTVIFEDIDEKDKATELILTQLKMLVDKGRELNSCEVK